MPYSFAAVDESGQTGLEVERGSTRSFAVTIVLTNAPQTIRDNVESLRRDLKLRDGIEFKFRGPPYSTRLAFLASAVTWPLVARTLYIDKQLLPVDLYRLKSWEFYGYFMADLLEHLPVGELGNTTMALDEFGPPKLTLRAIRGYLRQSGLDQLIKRIAFKQSCDDDMIQVADMFGGAIYRWLTDGDETYYRLIQSKTLVWAYHPPKAYTPT